MIVYSKENVVELQMRGTTILFSYGVPVAVATPGGRCFCTSQKYSVTTSKHIKAFLVKQGGDRQVSLVDQNRIDRVVLALDLLAADVATELEQK